MQPTHGKQLVVIELDAVWDWQIYFESLGTQVHGIAASHVNPDVNHSKRFVLRRDLCQMELPNWELNVPDCFKTQPVCPDDVVVMCKQFWCSTSLSQPPMVFLPHHQYKSLEKAPNEVLPRNTLSEKACKEYRKTAKFCNESAWKLTRAGKYLLDWVKQNEQKTWPPGPELPWLSTPNMQAPWMTNLLPLNDEWKKYAPGALLLRTPTLGPGTYFI